MVVLIQYLMLVFHYLSLKILFLLDKDIYANEILIMRIVWENSNRILFYSTSASNPIAGGAVAYAGNITATNIALFLAVEKNLLIANELIQKVAAGGLSIQIPFVYSFLNNLSGTSQTVSIRLNRGHGKTCKKIYHSIYN